MASFFDVPDDNFFQYIKEYWKDEHKRRMESTYSPIYSKNTIFNGYDDDDDTSSVISVSSSLDSE